MSAPQNIIGLVYDYDQTLSPTYMQDEVMFPVFGIKPAAFWKKCQVLVAEEGYDNELAYLKALLDSGSVRSVGEEQIDGVKTVHYTGSASVDAQLDRVPVESREKVKQELAKAKVTDVKYDLWVDQQQQVRRVKTSAGVLGVLVNYTDFGKPVTVATPPASETTDFIELLKKLKGTN